ncbi:MAG: hypothetical protein KC501_35335 [Myxococcales bacterium]|nr:hypothetical protein [Myxococcales bacterium]
MPRSRFRLEPCLALALALGCQRDGERPVEPDASDPVRDGTLHGWSYEVTVDPSLDTADVRVCFDGHPPARLIPGVPEALEHARDLHDDEGRPLPRRDEGYGLDAIPDDGCVGYTVDFEGLLASDGAGRMAGKTGNSLMVRPSVWLWRPDRLPAEVTPTLRFSLPEGMEVSVPWPATEPSARGRDATYCLEPTAFRWLAYAVVGELTVDRFERAGARVELVTLDAPLRCPPEGLRAWVEDAVDTVALLFDGRFPRDRLQVVVLPVEGGGGGTVYFGMAGRGGGPGIYVFLDDEAAAERLPGGWTTVHEMLHHGMPFIDEPWMAEGWVSYYTELMRTRMGHRSEQEGWQALLDAFERGRRRRMDLTLAQTSEQMHETHAYQRVYWGGASVAFLADVQMRLETKGERGLDDAMQELRRCCGDAPQMWKAQALLERLDAWYGRPLFSETARAVLSDRELPDVEAAMERIGVQVVDGEARLDDEHPAAAIRRAIMAPRR